jgi:hypothetical protein
LTSSRGLFAVTVQRDVELAVLYSSCFLFGSWGRVREVLCVSCCFAGSLVSLHPHLHPHRRRVPSPTVLRPRYLKPSPYTPTSSPVAEPHRPRNRKSNVLLHPTEPSQPAPIPTEIPDTPIYIYTTCTTRHTPNKTPWNVVRFVSHTSTSRRDDGWGSPRAASRYTCA